MMAVPPVNSEMGHAASAVSGRPAAGAIVYIGAQLPKRSETFVYRELLGLRARGWNVIPVSVRPPGAFTEEPELHALAGEAEVIYGPKTLFAPFWALIYPRTMLRALRDAVGERDLRPLQRLKLQVQACATA